MARNFFLPLLILAALAGTAPPLFALDPGAPPAAVITALARTGVVAPETVFIGTVSYPEISEVAADANGRVAEVHFEEGERVAAGATLAVLDAKVLEKEIEAIEASRAQAGVAAKKARLEAKRFRDLYERLIVSRQEYEDFLYAAEGLSLRTESLSAQVAALKEQLGKKKVVAPFAGVVLERRTERGEYLEPGGVVAILARDDEVDILVDVPEEITFFLLPGMEIEFEAGGGTGRGRLTAVIPRGEIRTRSFPVKIRAKNAPKLLDGMEARVRLPTGARRESILVPRDALVEHEGRSALFIVEEGSARLVYVESLAFAGAEAALSGGGLLDGAEVVIKGNERLRDGQAVTVLQEGD